MPVAPLVVSRLACARPAESKRNTQYTTWTHLALGNDSPTKMGDSSSSSSSSDGKTAAKEKKAKKEKKPKKEKKKKDKKEKKRKRDDGDDDEATK